MRKSSPKGPIILSDYVSTNIKSNLISTNGSLPPTVSLTNFKALYINNIIVQDIIMSNGIVSDVFRINDIIIESHVSRHILGGQDVIPISFSIPSDVDVISNQGISNDVPKADHVHAHGIMSGGSLHAVATSTSNGFMSSSDKIILDQIIPSNKSPAPLGVSYIGISNEYSRSDHIHAHGNQIGGSLHSVVTSVSNGFMSSSDKNKISIFSWNPSQTTFTLTQGFMNISSQPFGYLSSNSINRAIVSGIHTPLYNYYTTQNNLTNMGLSNGRFVVIYPGIYTINANITTLQTIQGSVFGYICVNNVQTLGTDFYSFTASSEIGTINMSAIVKLNSQDIVYITVFQNTGSNMNISSAGITNKFTIKLLYGNGQEGSSLPRWNQATFTNSIVALSGAPVAISSDGTLIVRGRPGVFTSGFTIGGAIDIYGLVSGVWTNIVISLKGVGFLGSARVGWSVAISSDKSTVVAGGPFDSSGIGASFVFTIVDGVWTQQGSKLVGTEASDVQRPQQGTSVAISADGNTLAVGGPNDDNIGATWIFTRTGDVWAQQGSKLVGTGGTGNPFQGSAVSISPDGNTLVVGAPNNNSGVGAVWLFGRSSGVWTQQGLLIDSGNIGASGQGTSVCLSADGNTLAVGGPGDNSGIGATWIYIRIDNVWYYQTKLVATGSIGAAAQGRSVSLSSDGNTLTVGGNTDNANIGAVWIFTRSGTIWTQSYKTVGYEPSAPSNVYRQGGTIAISGDGNTIVTGSIPSITSSSERYMFIFDRN